MPQTRDGKSLLRVCATCRFFAVKIKIRIHAVAPGYAIFILFADGPHCHVLHPLNISSSLKVISSTVRLGSCAAPFSFSPVYLFLKKR
jgi:hypothetical protein